MFKLLLIFFSSLEIFTDLCLQKLRILLFNCSAVSDSLWPHGLQHARLPCPSLSPRVCSDSCPSLLFQVIPSTYLILCCPLLLLPSIFPSIGIFSNELALLIRWSKYWSFNFSISPSNEYSVLISFRIDWFDLLVVRGLTTVFSSITIRKHQYFGA